MSCVIEWGTSIFAFMGERLQRPNRLKAGSNTKLLALPREVLEQVERLLINSNMSLRAISQWLGKEHNVAIPINCLSYYYGKYLHEFVIERRRRAAGLADKVSERIGKDPEKFYKVTMDELARRGMKVALNEESTPKDLEAMIAVLVRARKQAIDERKLSLMERRLKILERRQSALEEALSKRSSRLNDDKFVERIRKVFGREEITQNGLESAVSAANGERNGHTA
jgi:hypothetical protein